MVLKCSVKLVSIINRFSLLTITRFESEKRKSHAEELERRFIASSSKKDFGSIHPYETLGIRNPISVSAGDIRKAYRQLSLAFHPDKNPTKKIEAEKVFTDIAAAFEVRNVLYQSIFFPEYQRILLFIFNFTLKHKDYRNT